MNDELARQARSLRARLEPARLHAATVRRTVRRYGFRPHRLFVTPGDEPVFVFGSPRSGTSFTAEALGGVTGFVDLGEVNALKAAIPRLLGLPADEAAAAARRLFHRTKRLSLVGGRRAIEQTPESTFVLESIAAAFPRARFLHLLRDGRDVVCSLKATGWLRPVAGEGARRDDAGQPYGGHARFWVEADRRGEFARASEVTRCAWAWRRYEAVAGRFAALEPVRCLTIRYEELARGPAAEAERVAAFLGFPDRVAELEQEFGEAFATSVGRYRRDLTAAELAEVEREAGALLRERGYLDAAG